jgi:hypothetical protein
MAAMTKPSRSFHMKPLDIVMLVMSLGVTVVSGLWSWTDAASSSTPMVEIDSTQGKALYPLSENRDLAIAGPAGTTLLRIENGQVFAVRSPGPLGIMVQMGKISHPGQWIASLPNKVFVKIVGGAAVEAGPDVSVY